MVPPGYTLLSRLPTFCCCFFAVSVVVVDNINSVVVVDNINNANRIAYGRSLSFAAHNAYYLSNSSYRSALNSYWDISDSAALPPARLIPGDWCYDL